MLHDSFTEGFIRCKVLNAFIFFSLQKFLRAWRMAGEFRMGKVRNVRRQGRSFTLARINQAVPSVSFKSTEVALFQAGTPTGHWHLRHATQRSMPSC